MLSAHGGRADRAASAFGREFAAPRLVLGLAPRLPFVPRPGLQPDCQQLRPPPLQELPLIPSRRGRPPASHSPFHAHAARGHARPAVPSPVPRWSPLVAPAVRKSSMNTLCWSLERLRLPLPGGTCLTCWQQRWRSIVVSSLQQASPCWQRQWTRPGIWVLGAGATNESLPVCCVADWCVLFSTCPSSLRSSRVPWRPPQAPAQPRREQHPLS